MKKIILFGTILILFSSYDPEPDMISYTPVLMTREKMETAIEYIEPIALVKPGKMYILGNTVYINERYKGIHVIDNTNPTAPVKKGFLRIPGCIDLAVKGNILYADNATDLIAVDLSDIENVHVTKRIINTFPELLPPGYNWMPWQFSEENRPENTIIVGWEKI